MAGRKKKKKEDERRSQELSDPHSGAARLDDKAVLEGGRSNQQPSGGAATCWIAGEALSGVPVVTTNGCQSVSMEEAEFNGSMSAANQQPLILRSPLKEEMLSGL